MDGAVTPEPGDLEPPEPQGPCGRAPLLLSLVHDGEATADQAAEAAAHLATCEECRRAVRTDVAVRVRLADRAQGDVSDGFLGRFADAFARQRAAAAQNRFLRFAAAAAVLVAAAAGATSLLSQPGGDGAAEASVKDFTHWALVRPEGRQ